MKVFGLKGIFMSLLLAGAAGVYFASVFPASETVEVQAEVLSRTGRSGPTGTVGILICRLESGKSITVELPPHGSASKGDRVMLRTYERYLFGNEYHFGGKLVDESKS